MKDKEKSNPIDKEKVTETPSTLPYAHHVGSAVIRPLDRGKIEGLAVQAMYEQSDMALEQIKKQVELLMDQAKSIHDRVAISEKIYKAEYSFAPIIGQMYFLYEKKEEQWVISMIGPEQWGKKGSPYRFLHKVKLLADHTWEIKE